MPVLDEDTWLELIAKACDNNPVAVGSIDDLWLRRASLDTADPSGDLRYYTVVVDCLELALADASKNVQASEGGGISGSYNQYYDHLKGIYDLYVKNRDKQVKQVIGQLGPQIAAIATASLTPVSPGYLDPGHPGFTGDPRYRVIGGTP